MNRGGWTDVRVEKRELGNAVAALAAKFSPLTVRIDKSPPAAGPEVEIAVYDRDERGVCQVLSLAAINVLASRER